MLGVPYMPALGPLDAKTLSTLDAKMLGSLETRYPSYYREVPEAAVVFPPHPIQLV